MCPKNERQCPVLPGPHSVGRMITDSTRHKAFMGESKIGTQPTILYYKQKEQQDEKKIAWF